jgi:hypothetical protein
VDGIDCERASRQPGADRPELEEAPLAALQQGQDDTPGDERLPKSIDQRGNIPAPFGPSLDAQQPAPQRSRFLTHLCSVKPDPPDAQLLVIPQGVFGPIEAGNGIDAGGD